MAVVDSKFLGISSFFEAQKACLYVGLVAVLVNMS